MFTRRLLTTAARVSTIRRQFATTSSSKPAVYDMTSDTATEVTDDMFDIMKRASRKDDVFGADDSINDLEHHVAQLLGHEAALFCASGTMTNQLGLRTLLTQPPHSVLCDARSHIYNYECGGLAYNSQAGLTPTMPKNNVYLTAEDVDYNINTDDLCGAPTRVIALENTLNGVIMPLKEMERIHTLARNKGLLLHLDGARLWNASQATGIPLSEYGGLFDTVSVCVSKGVGAPIGSLVVGSRDRIKRARHVRKLLGGGWRQAGLLAAVARHCIDTIVPTMPETHRLTSRLANHLETLGMRILLPCDTNMIFLDTAPWVTVNELADALAEKNIIIGRDEGTVTRIVLHHQIDEQAVQNFINIATRLSKEKKQLGKRVVDEDHRVDISRAYPSASR
ncbi:threonine aldolase [Lichtheimia corymbifera JMRC:FSU:9682]|uniref:Threonine aldolase n=1 Tax=Lichtheimia corymbifera JMRC:FSU:9682 TaxID=1263082 RepID=A0A068S0C6_9FUNG|nr:threonine aldolase [Lichtheimia corymbifera JMRC:FSU:9682]